MPYIPSKLFSGEITNVLSNVYTVDSPRGVIVKSIIISNNNSFGSVKIDLHFVNKKNSGALVAADAKAENIFLKDFEIFENDAAVIEITHVLESGDAIFCKTNSSAKAVLHISGVEVD